MFGTMEYYDNAAAEWAERGYAPRHFGEIATFKLSNSGIIVSVSTTKFYRVDEMNSDELIEPYIKCKSNKALEALVEYLKEGD